MLLSAGMGPLQDKNPHLHSFGLYIHTLSPRRLSTHAIAGDLPPSLGHYGSRSGAGYGSSQQQAPLTYKHSLEKEKAVAWKSWLPT